MPAIEQCEIINNKRIEKFTFSILFFLEKYYICGYKYYLRFAIAEFMWGQLASA